MGIFSRFESRMEDTVEGAANKMFDSPISPVQIAKKAEKQMRREKMVGAGKQYAPTLYTVLVNAEDDERLFGYYPTLAGETETYLSAKAVDEGLVMDGQPLVRFIADEGLKRGKFEVIAELVASPIITQLRAEEMDRYGIGKGVSRSRQTAAPLQRPVHPVQEDYMQVPQTGDRKPPLPYVPEDEIDYSIDYGEYTFDSQNFDDQQHDNDEAAYYQSVPHENMDANYNESHRRASVPLEAQNPGVIPGGVLPVQGANPDEGVPHTVVFAPGSGNAQPAPNRSMVRASLMDTSNNRTYDLATNRLIIGRDKKSDIVVDDINASRAHAELRFESQGVWMLSDLGSTNGTFVNGADISNQALNDGDYLTVGTTNFLFMLGQ